MVFAFGLYCYIYYILSMDANGKIKAPMRMLLLIL